MKDLIKSVLTSSSDRLKHPIIGVFISSLIIINWRAISYFILSKEIVEVRLSNIDSYLSYSWLGSLLLALLISLLYNALPIMFMWTIDAITNPFFKWRNSFQKERKELLLKVSNLEAWEVEKKEFQIKINDLDLEIQNYKKERTQIEGQLNSIEDEYESIKAFSSDFKNEVMYALNESLTYNMKEILKYLIFLQEYKRKEEVIRYPIDIKGRIEDNVEGLVRIGLMDLKTKSYDGTEYIKLSELGTTYVEWIQAQTAKSISIPR